MDYIPRKDSDKIVWNNNLSAQIEAEGATLGLTPAEIADIKATAGENAAAIVANDDAQFAARTAKAAKDTQIKTGEKMIREIELQIKDKYQVSYVRVMHRIGYLDVSETAIIAIAYAAHRRESFQACEEAVERVKHEVPIWKEEFFMDGTSQYVEGCCIRKDTPESEVPAKTHSHTHQHDHCAHDHTHE